jgi:hypothetical protein
MKYEMAICDSDMINDKIRYVHITMNYEYGT